MYYILCTKKDMAHNLSNNQSTMASTQPVAQPIDPPCVDSQPEEESVAPNATESVAPPASSSIDVEADAPDVAKPLADDGKPPTVAVVIDDPPGVDSQPEEESVAPNATESVAPPEADADVQKPLADDGKPPIVAVVIDDPPAGVDSQPQDESVAPPATESVAPTATESVAPPASSSIDVEAVVVDDKEPHAKEEGYCTPSPPIVAVVIDEEVELDPVDSQQVDPPGKSFTEKKTSEEMEVDMLDEDDSLEVEPPAKKQKTQRKSHTYKSNYFLESTQPWRNSNNKEYFTTTADIEAAYHKFAYIQFGGTNYNNLSWRPFSWKKKLDGTRVRLLRCGYQHACGCPYLAKEVELINGEHCFFSGTVPHSRHNVLLDRMTGVPPQIKAVIDSPTVLRLLPNQFLH